MNSKPQSKRSRATAMDIRPARRPAPKPHRPAAAAASASSKVPSKSGPKKKPGLLSRLHKAIRTHPLRNHPFAVPVATFVLLSFFSMAVFVASNGKTLGASDTRLVKLYIDGEQQVIPTRAATVKELLERLDIAVSEKDIVEPALDTEIIESDFSVSVFKARAVTIIDGDKEVTTVTAAPTPQGAAKHAGITVYPEDKVETQANVIETEDVLRGRAVAETIVIDRATPATINLYGSNIPIRTHVMTVGEALAEKNIKTLPDDVITPALSTVLTPDTKVFITRVGSQIDSREEEIAMPVETINDPNLLVGNIQVRQQGNPGRKVVTYEVQLENDKEISRRPIQEIIAVHPVKHIVVKGTKVVYSNPSSNVALGQQIAGQMGWGHQFSCIYSIFQRESGWNQLSRNRYSGAYGIPQALPGSKMGPGWESDPAVQIRWGIGYMVGRYGSPCGAQAFWEVNHWY